jgi:predicted ATP-dependent endonuclease of OLD family
LQQWGFNMYLKIDKIEISNYKSVYKAELKLNRDSNNTFILIGKNGTGKSKLLEAITRTKYLYQYNYNNTCTKKYQTQKDPITIKYVSNIENDRKQYIHEIKKILKAPNGFWKVFKIISVAHIYTMPSIGAGFTKKIIYNICDISYDMYCYRAISEQEKTKEEPQQYEIVKYSKDIDTSVYKKLSKSFFDNNIFSKVFNFNIDSSLWTSEDNNILQDVIDIKQFSNNPDINIPMKNIFNIAGYKTNQSIANVLKEATQDEIQLQTLEAQLSYKANEYISKIWNDNSLKEKLKFKISRDNSNQFKIKTTVTGENEQNGIYSIDDISDGFKQFTSVLLSFDIKENSNNIIAIDEPEVHLHPSAAMYLKEKLIELGNNNYVFFSTHTPFMIDANVPERHYKLEKEDSLTQVAKLAPNTNMNDDELTETLFGINTLRDFYAPNRMLVEGQSDKTIIDYGLKLLNKNQCIVITNGKGDNIVPTASYINLKKVNNVLTILDADEAGIRDKDTIISIGGIYSNKNVFTLKDIVPSLPEKATIEDLLEEQYVAKIFNEYMAEQGYSNNFVCNPNTNSILIQIRTYCSINRITLTSNQIKEIKTRIAENFKIKSGALKTKNQKLNELLLFVTNYFEEVNNA